MSDDVRERWESRSIAVIILSASFILLILPFYITFNEFFTSVVKSIGLWYFIDRYISPIVAAMTSSMLQLMNIKASFSGSIVYIIKSTEIMALYIAWNCIGWQSLVIFSAISYLSLRDSRLPRLEKLVIIILGLEGTLLINIFRIALVGLVAVYFGKLHAILFHDYIGSLISFGWLLGFWYLFSHKSSRESLEDEES
ncbi:MAG: exosortase/archaeosortase family protein [Aigarchaeota archaeon]|nr:exosortase/archaeosortase family protein [Aigarchaeota archaeon]MCX8192202.1 exosortase/archaeosortase family protein [Nitrososphaeria archaeon]MDW7986192.1 exosortase/archaeosortase family protein [Nitrososphaerota archaeon]